MNFEEGLDGVSAEVPCLPVPCLLTDVCEKAFCAVM